MEVNVRTFCETLSFHLWAFKYSFHQDFSYNIARLTVTTSALFPEESVMLIFKAVKKSYGWMDGWFARWFIANNSSVLNSKIYDFQIYSSKFSYSNHDFSLNDRKKEKWKLDLQEIGEGPGPIQS